MKFKKIFISIGTIITIGTTIFPIISCGSNKQIDGLESASTGFGNYYVLNKENYNDLYHKLDDNHVGVSIIANHKIYSEVISVVKDETVIEALDSSKFHFKRYIHKEMGAFINSFSLKDNPLTYIHGTSTEKNYGDYYPLYFINHKFAQLGVSNFHLAGHEMLEFTYDDK